ncbi:MAG: 2Fe-2S iron-sulfur cluster-binding protein [Lutibacter sp.]
MSKFNSLKIKAVKQETPQAVSITFEIPELLQKEYQFIPGQYVNLKAIVNGIELRRAYSICSTPFDKDLKIAVKAIKNGQFSTYATSQLKAGDQLNVTFPEGRFNLNVNSNQSKNYVAIAAGSGITPIMAMIKTVLIKEPKSNFTLIYGNKTTEDTIFKTEIDQLLSDYPNQFYVQYVFSRAKEEQALFGRIDEGIINFTLNKKIKINPIDDVFICGPEQLIDSAKSIFIEKGLDESQIHFELFSTPQQTKEVQKSSLNGVSEITVLLDDEESSFKMDAKKSILKAALDEGLDAPYSCQGGICSSCLAKVIEGNAIMDKNTILTDKEVAEGFILTCQAHPTTEKLIVDYDAV